MKNFKDLPFASTLCGSCTNVCPVKIDLHNQLYEMRQEIVKAGYGGTMKTWAMKKASLSLSTEKEYNSLRKKVNFIYKNVPFLMKNSMNPWYTHREMPELPKESFRDWYLKNGNNE